MKKLNELLIVEADEDGESLISQYQSFLQPFSHAPVRTQTLNEVATVSAASSPQLVLLHSNLTTIQHLRQFVTLLEVIPYSTIIIVGDVLDDELCLLALEAGAEDAITKENLTPAYLRKVVLISERRHHMEKELGQSRTQLLACIQNTPNVAMQWFNERGEVIFWNKASERIFGWTAEEAEGKTLDQLILSPEDAKLFRQKIASLKATGNTPEEPLEFRFRRRNGSEGYCISTLFPIMSFNGEARFVCTDIDITDRKRMEEASRQSEEKYRLLVEQHADAITVFDQQGKIEEVNSSAVDMLQYTPEELTQMNIRDLILEEDLQTNPLAFTLLEEGEATIKQRRLRRKDGGLVEIEVHTKRLSNGHYMASVRDIAKRMAIQHELQKEIALSDSIINSLPGLFYLFTQEGKYLRWNRQLEIITGYTSEEIKNIHPLAFFAEEDKACVVEAIESVYKNGSSTVEVDLLTKDGKKIPYFFTGLTVDYGGVPCLLGVGIDLSAVKNLEKELADQKIAEQKKLMQAMIDAQETEKNKLGLELHDNINQILSVIRMYLTILDSGQSIEEITLSKTIQLLNTAINEIRQLSHSLAVSYQFETGITDALEDMAEKIRLTRELSLSVDIAPDLNERTNQYQKLAIYRIVQEQLNNILKYAKASEAEVKIETTTDHIQLTIRDNGQGFNSLQVRKGLGLNNITSRAEALGGKMLIRSAPGKGCRLVVTIPFQPERKEEG